MRCSHLCSNANTGTYPKGETGARWDREPCDWGSRAAFSPSHNIAAALLLKAFPRGPGVHGGREGSHSSAPWGLTEQLSFSNIERKDWACFLVALEVSSEGYFQGLEEGELGGARDPRHPWHLTSLGLYLPICKVKGLAEMTSPPPPRTKGTSKFQHSMIPEH